MATLADLATKTLDVIYGVAQVERPLEDIMDGAFTAGTLTMPVATDAFWKQDDIAEFAVDGELVICAADATGGNVTVRRGQRGTTDANQSSGDVITKNPPHPRFRVEEMINQVVRNDLWPHVWTWHQDTFTFVDGTHTYALDLYIPEVVLVYQYDLNSDKRMHPLNHGAWDTERQVDSGLATNSNLLRVRSVYDSSATVYYVAKRRPDPADLSNMSSEVADLIPWAAAGKLMAVRSPQVHSDTARGRHDEPGSQQNDYRGLMAEFLRMRSALRLQLRDEVFVEPRFRSRFRRRF